MSERERAGEGRREEVTDKQALRGYNPGVIGFVSNPMCHTVHTPSDVQDEDVAKHHGAEIGNEQSLSPEIPGNDRWQNEVE